MKQRNPGWGCPRIAQQNSLALGVEIDDKNIVRRVLSVHYRPESDSGGPSWLTFLGNAANPLGSYCDGPVYPAHHWFGVHSSIVDGVALCRLFHRAIRGHSLPKYLSSDHDPLFRFHQWAANPRILEVTGIKTDPYAPAFAPLRKRFAASISTASYFGPQPIWGRS
jgi:putative transposase